MLQSAHDFIGDEDGAVTVDWVVLTAAILLVVIGAFVGIQNGSDAMGERIGAFMTDTDAADLRPPAN